MNLKTPKEKIKTCEKCNSLFKSYQQRSRFCSKECRFKDRREKLNYLKNIAIQTNGIYQSKPIIEHYYNSYKNGAKNKKVSFNMSIEEFSMFWKQKCHYCNDDINAIGIDRKNSEIGYESENIVPCCVECNLMKRKTSYQDFIDRCNKIYFNTKHQNS